MLCLVSYVQPTGDRSGSLPRGPFLETPDNFPGPVSTFFELIYLSANGNHWLKLSDMLHEIIKIKI